MFGGDGTKDAAFEETMKRLIRQLEIQGDSDIIITKGDALRIINKLRATDEQYQDLARRYTPRGYTDD